MRKGVTCRTESASSDSNILIRADGDRQLPLVEGTLKNGGKASRSSVADRRRFFADALA
jgi:hypothetical protein